MLRLEEVGILIATPGLNGWFWNHNGKLSNLIIKWQDFNYNVNFNCVARQEITLRFKLFGTITKTIQSAGQNIRAVLCEVN